MGRERIGIFGGSFDPPHLAHLIAGELAVEEFGLAKMLYIPAGISPFKQTEHRTSGEHRLAMIQLAIARNSHFEVSDLELQRRGASYTIDTLHELRKQYPSQEFYLFIGFDNLMAFDRWKDPEGILNEAKVVAIARPGSSIEDLPTAFARRTQIFDIPLLDTSSTLVRDRIHTGKSVRYMIPEAVEEYIRKNNLYR
jgi:nicotinate-nucleotide adenylyltransferase